MPVISLLFSHSKKETNSRNDSSTLNNFNKYIPFDSKNTKLIYKYRQYEFERSNNNDLPRSHCTPQQEYSDFWINIKVDPEGKPISS